MSINVELTQQAIEFLLHLIMIQSALVKASEPNSLVGLVEYEVLHFVPKNLVAFVALLQKLLQFLIVHGLVHLFVKGFGELHLVRLLVFLNVGLVVIRVEGAVYQELGFVLGICQLDEVIEDLFDDHADFVRLHDGVGKVNSSEGFEVVNVVVVLVFNLEQVPNASPDHFHNSYSCFKENVIARFPNVVRRDGEDEVGSQN